MLSTRSPHSFIGIDQTGRTCVLRTSGNDDGHIVLRGGRRGPNYHRQTVQEAESLFEGQGLTPAIVVDCSHGNSGKNHTLQNGVLESILSTVTAQRRRGRDSIVGFMIESNLHEGNQQIPSDLRNLRYGVSITDQCVGWEQTREMILRAFDQVPNVSPTGVDA